jgi:glycosyltransferase involved in cell wall biosynthesis
VLARLAATYPDARLEMIGPDKDGSQRLVENRAVDLGVRERIALVGQLPKREIPARLAAADVFLNTTNVDNTPLSVLEAMATGLCVVSTSVGGIPYLLRDGETALLVPRDDAARMAAAVERVLADPILAARLSSQGRVAAEERAWDRVLPRWDEMLDEAAHDV